MNMTTHWLLPVLAIVGAFLLPAPAQQVVLIEDVTGVQGRPSQLPPLSGSWMQGEEFEFGGAGSPRVTLLVPQNDRHVLHTAASMLTDLQRRHRDSGLRVLGVVPAEPADEAMALWGDLSLLLSRRMYKTLRPDNGIPDPVCIANTDGELLWYGPVDAGISHWIESALAGTAVPDAAAAHTTWRLESLGEIEDYDDKRLSTMADAMVDTNPRNPEGWILRLILAVERQVDREAAREVAAEAFRNLGMDQAALGRFVEKMLRTVKDDEKLLQKAFVAMVPVAALAEHDLRLQLTYLKVLNGLGRAKEAERLAKRLVEEVETRPELRGPLAEAMAFGKQPELFAETAKRLIEDAVRADPLEEELRYIQYLVLLRCCDDEEAAKAALRPLMEGRSSLNNTAWYMMTMDRNGRGRFDAVALAFCRHMVANERLTSMEQDTVALSYYLNGLLEEAVELQETACSGTNDPAYHRRLDRFRKALEQREGDK